MNENFTLTSDWLFSQESEMIGLVEKWASINSWSENLEGLSQMLGCLADDFACLEADMSIVPLSPRTIVNSQGDLIEKPLGKALSIKKRPAAPLKIFLAGHMDTVYPPQHVMPLKREGDLLKGPGVTDMKGGLVVLLKSLQALERSPFREKIGWEVLINPDEEIGSPGSFALFKDAATRNHIGLIFEPSFPDGAFVSKRKGSANFAVIAKGRKAHAGRDFHIGKSAIFALAHFIHQLEAWNRPGSSITINVGSIEGGGPLNIVPDLASCRLNIRAETKAEMDQLISQIEHIIKECSKREGIQLTLYPDTIRFPKAINSKTEKLFYHLEMCAKELKIPFQLRQSGGVCDGNILSYEGLPTIDSLGVTGGEIHTDNEYLILSSLVERSQLATLLLFKLLGDISHV